jgi:2-keto-4-pentenoate hydratase/2-oxohepta-3-ene-1,7-dioic acid hydratase in catechol pathway
MLMRIAAYDVEGLLELFVRTAAGWVRLGNIDLMDLIQAEADGNGLLQDRIRQAAEFPFPPAGACPLAPVGRPGKMIFAGENYRDHVDEVRETATVSGSGGEPPVFSKLPSSIIGPGAAIRIPADSALSHVDYEGELAVVIGRRATRLTTENALEHVFGYTIVNDVTDRQWQFERNQLTMAKGMDTFCPMGPTVVLKDEIPDPDNLEILTWVNGELRQHSSTQNLIFSVAQLLAYISKVVTLYPGDIVSTGTPGGVGFTRTPPAYLQAGDIIEIEVEDIGRLSNPVVSFDASFDPVERRRDE